MSRHNQNSRSQKAGDCSTVNQETWHEASLSQHVQVNFFELDSEILKDCHLENPASWLDHSNHSLNPSKNSRKNY